MLERTYATWQTAHRHLYHRPLPPPRPRALHLLRAAQGLVVPPLVRQLLHLGRGCWLRLLIPVYRRPRHLAPSRWAREALLPAAYRPQIRGLDAVLGGGRVRMK